MRVQWRGLLLGGLSLAGVLARAETLTLTPVADACLFSASPGNSLGHSDTIAVGGTAHLQPARGLVKFDVATALPAGAVIVSAKLTVTVTKVPLGNVPSRVSAYRMRVAWSEGAGKGNTGSPAQTGDSTWTHRVHPTEAWSVPGAAPGTEYVGVASGQADMPSTGSYTLLGTGLAEDVALWLTQPTANHGWILVDDQEQVAATARRIATREAGSTAPRLTVEYVMAAPPVLNRWGRVGDRFELEFRGEAGNAYEVQYRDAWGGTGTWGVLTNVVVKLVSTNVVVSDSLGAAARFYRVADVGDVD